MLLPKEVASTNVTYNKIRLALGLIGITLPFLLWAFNAFQIERSISCFYHTDTTPRDIFVGALFLFGVFLISYYGHPKDTSKNEITTDNTITNIAGILVLVTALVPTSEVDKSTPQAIIHLASAAGFFALMGYMSFQHFTRGSDDTTLKKIKHVVYRLAGTVIWLSLIYLGYRFLNDSIEGNIIFWMEVIMLECFGLAWLIKGIPD